RETVRAHRPPVAPGAGGIGHRCRTRGGVFPAAAADARAFGDHHAQLAGRRTDRDRRSCADRMGARGDREECRGCVERARRPHRRGSRRGQRRDGAGDCAGRRAGCLGRDAASAVRARRLQQDWRLGHRTRARAPDRGAAAWRPRVVSAGRRGQGVGVCAGIPADVTQPLPLNPAQREAVEHPGGPLLVLAGAGSGKTRVLTARIAHLITTLHVAPQRIFAVTFTNKAAGEMRSRIGQLLGADPRGLWIGTFHSLSARLLRREAPLLGFGSNFTIYDSDDSEALVKRLLEARQLSTKVYSPRSVHGVISSAKNRMLTPEELGAQQDTPLIKVAAEIYAALGPALKQANAMDFDDLLLHPLTLFREHPERLAY